MARKVKISNELLKRYAREEHKRKHDIKPKLVYYLIVCEGEATEPNYFEGMKQDLPKGVLTAIQGTGRNTQSLVDEALRLKSEFESKRDLPVDKLWVVFDKDSFSAHDFNAAILRCKSVKPEIGCAWSNEAFELWYLLHFHIYRNGIKRGDYPQMIEKNLQKFEGASYRYQKNNTEMYDLLKKHSNVEDAIRNAKSLGETYEGRQDYANHNPYTMVWQLVEELLGLNFQDSTRMLK